MVRWRLLVPFADIGRDRVSGSWTNGRGGGSRIRACLLADMEEAVGEDCKHKCHEDSQQDAVVSPNAARSFVVWPLHGSVPAGAVGRGSRT